MGSALVRDFSLLPVVELDKEEGWPASRGRGSPAKGLVCVHGVSGGEGPRAALLSSAWTCLTSVLQGPAAPK